MCSKHSAPRVVACAENPQKITVAQAVSPSTDVPGEVRIILRYHSTLEISPLITIIRRCSVSAQLGRRCLISEYVNGQSGDQLQHPEPGPEEVD